MLLGILIASLLLGSAGARYLEYLKVDSEDLNHGTLISGDSHAIRRFSGQAEDLAALEEMIPGVCAVCKMVIKTVRKHLSKSDNVEKIKTKLMGVCDKLPIVKGLCKKLVNKHIDVLVRELSTNDDPKTICAKAKMCKSVGVLDLLQTFQIL